MIKLIKSTFYKEEFTKNKLNQFVKTADFLSFGQECIKFEKNFARWQKRKYAVMVNSGSSANLAIIQALLNLGKIKKGDYVGFSGVTWATNVMPLFQLGLNPIPVDVERDSLNVSSSQLEKVLKKYPIKMLFLTNLLGFCDDIDKILDICKKSKIILIEDNCESLGTIYKGKLLGNFGLASSFSFYVGHHMSTIEGGAICTDNTELASMLKIVRAHGWDRNLSASRQLKIRIKHNVNETFYSRYTFYDLGYNLRTTEINGFLGNIQLGFLKEIIRKRADNFQKLSKEIYKRNDLYYPLKYDHIDLVSNFAFPLICKSKRIRELLVEKCKNLVEIRPIVGGDMQMQPFFRKHSNINLDNPNARIIHEQGLYFGNNPDLTEREINKLITIFCKLDLRN